MLIKWEDLEPGDKLKFTEMAKKEFYLYDWITDEELEIYQIEPYSVGNLLVSFSFTKKFPKGLSIYFNKYDGKWDGIQMFDIVSLKED